MYANEVKGHLRAIDRKHHALIQSEIETQLINAPNVETRNRKPLKRPISFGAEWELRLGPKNRFRVFYQVNADSCEVHVLAIGVKERSRLLFGERSSKNENCIDRRCKGTIERYVKASLEGPVVVTRNGKAVAVLLAVTEDDELERLLLRTRPSSKHFWKSRSSD